MQKQDKLVRKTWGKNERLIKSFFLFKFKEIRKRLESVRALSNKRLPNGKKIKNRDLTKCSDLLWKRRHGRKPRQKTFMKSSMKSEDMAHNILEDLPEGSRVWPRSEKHAYPKTFKWFQRKKMSGRLDISTSIEQKK